MNSELQMPVGIVVMYMDHNGFYCIKENLSWLTPGTSHPGRLPLSPSFKFEVDDISVHFRKQISKMKCAPPNWEPFQIGSLSELRGIPNGSYFEWQCVFEHHASLHTHHECVVISNGFHEWWLQTWEPLWKGAFPCPGLLEGCRIFRLNPETDTHPKTFRFHAKSHSKSEDLPFCDQMPLGVHFKRHCAR